MARLRLELDQETYLKLLDSALAEKRPIDWQAEVVLRRAMGLPFPREREAGSPGRDLVAAGAVAAPAEAASSPIAGPGAR